ncbi:imidazoleglycerol-phosphate dehydratase HisB [Anaeromusa sp.]|jgi:imidazoleglycerol-phosphate dehydratase|uniref:imidazoleglycerol-phosphate dehydratase HisB n=1 Tax=Anaeromusa sp. TaxID=1872520 RepID=UPI00261B8AC8|nr:imidazoleglycerol-phosphate dehydratase HisB [Anaeromusa sp.]MDD3158176.1 imidazoleglycerol-phosphate dehydratase HisB [Anaeromusa sp.]NCB75784.1 imidazoleglycerol-phosphate dehydratase HisB [Negativicutes bacterium]
MRTAAVERRTAETKICLSVQLDEPKTPLVQTGLGFFDHMLVLLGRHGFFGLQLEVQGDLEVDGHHTVEDTGICLGQALQQALGDKAGIARYGTAFVPMDEALAMVSLDISGRPYLVFEAQLPFGKVGDFDLELVEEFLRALSVHAGLTLHVRLLSGKNAHHMVEAIFKALGRALAEAMAKDSRVRGVLSTKGTLD